MTETGTMQIIAHGRVWSAATGRATRESGESVQQQAIVAQQGRIAATGALDELRRRFPAAEVFDCGGRGQADLRIHVDGPLEPAG